jgi:hypothetical protein
MAVSLKDADKQYAFPDAYVVDGRMIHVRLDLVGDADARWRRSCNALAEARGVPADALGNGSISALIVRLPVDCDPTVASATLDRAADLISDAGKKIEGEGNLDAKARNLANNWWTAYFQKQFQPPAR